MLKKETSLERRKDQLMEAQFATPQTNRSFFKSLSSSLKKLSGIRRMKLRSTIMNCVIAELETVQEHIHSKISF